MPRSASHAAAIRLGDVAKINGQIDHGNSSVTLEKLLPLLKSPPIAMVGRYGACGDPLTPAGVLVRGCGPAFSTRTMSSADMPRSSISRFISSWRSCFRCSEPQGPGAHEERPAEYGQNGDQANEPFARIHPEEGQTLVYALFKTTNFCKPLVLSIRPAIGFLGESRRAKGNCMPVSRLRLSHPQDRAARRSFQEGAATVLCGGPRSFDGPLAYARESVAELHVGRISKSVQLSVNGSFGSPSYRSAAAITARKPIRSSPARSLS